MNRQIEAAEQLGSNFITYGVSTNPPTVELSVEPKKGEGWHPPQKKKRKASSYESIAKVAKSGDMKVPQDSRRVEDKQDRQIQNI